MGKIDRISKTLSEPALAKDYQRVQNILHSQMHYSINYVVIITPKRFTRFTPGTIGLRHNEVYILLLKTGVVDFAVGLVLNFIRDQFYAQNSYKN